MIIDGNLTVKDLISKLEQDIAEQSAFLESLKKVVVVGEPVSNAHKPKQVAVTIKKKKKSKPEVVTAASRVKDLLKAADLPLEQTEIRNRLKEQGVDTSRPTYLSSLYTAMIRKPEWFIRLADGRWALVEWDVEKLNSDAQRQAVGNQLFETV